jgi:hypothetical protein
MSIPFRVSSIQKRLRGLILLFRNMRIHCSYLGKAPEEQASRVGDIFGRHQLILHASMP